MQMKTLTSTWSALLCCNAWDLTVAVGTCQCLASHHAVEGPFRCEHVARLLVPSHACQMEGILYNLSMVYSRPPVLAKGLGPGVDIKALAIQHLC